MTPTEYEHWLTYRSWETEQHHDRYYEDMLEPGSYAAFRHVRLATRTYNLVKQLIRKHGIDNWHTQPLAYPDGIVGH